MGITYLVNSGVMDLGRLVELMTEKPAKALNLPVGRLEEGAEADFVLFDPEKEWVVRAGDFRSRSRNSSYLGEKLSGKVAATFMRGRLTWLDPELAPCGEE